jgi:CHASE2 domain-containing sensor protein
MSKTVVLNLGSGNLNSGFSHITARLWTDQHPHAEQMVGNLPAAPELIRCYRIWQSTYLALCDRRVIRSAAEATGELEIDDSGITQVSQLSFQELSQQIQQQINVWLRSEGFFAIERQLRSQLNPGDEIRVIFEANNDLLQRLPWHCWDFFRDYPQAEMALSQPEYRRRGSSRSPAPRKKVRVLAILGSCQDIDVEAERQFLQRLPNTEVKFLITPLRQEFNQQLWDASGWDILFFAGHSHTEGTTGRIYINQNPSNNSLTIEQLEEALGTAIDNGLKLAIFNSCDGIGLAQALGRLYIPQVIVMREPVPNRVAQEFLRYFLEGFALERLPLYPAVRQARRKLQGLEDEFPGASWLPVLCQNPAEIPPHWQAWFKKSSIEFRLPTQREVQTIVLSSLLVTGLVAAVRWLGLLQPLELWAFDHLMQLRPQEESDPRILVVTVTEQDIQAQGNEPRLGSLSDRTLNRLLEKLEQNQPVAIGLDIYRDYPATLPMLAKRMQQSDRLFAICKSPDPKDDPAGVAPPPEIAESRLGFSDVVEDSDGVLRRHLLMMPANPVSACTPTQALNVQLAFRYLKTKGIVATFTPENKLKLGNQVFQRLEPRTGGYQPVDARGTQILLNYRALSSTQEIAQRATVAQVLAGQLNPRAVKDRIVLIGVAANTRGDYWPTPYGSAFSKQVPGVFLQAQMVSQLLSAVLDQRPLLGVWSQWGEVVWIWGWALTGGILIWYARSVGDWLILTSIATGILSGCCIILLVNGVWAPLVPCGLVLLLTGGWVAFTVSQTQN